MEFTYALSENVILNNVDTHMRFLDDTAILFFRLKNGFFLK